jgi:hypothetical protein
MTTNSTLTAAGRIARHRRRGAYLAGIINAVIVSEDKIRIIGSNDNVRSTFGPKGQPTRWFVNLFRNGAQGRVVPRPI